MKTLYTGTHQKEYANLLYLFLVWLSNIERRFFVNEIKIFENPDFGEIRTIIIDGEPWFVAKDISDKLGYTRTSSMTKQIDEEDRMIFDCTSQAHPNFSAKVRQIGIINESGLYAAIFSSTLENAKKFKRWVTSEVLPSIRKTGSYTTPQLQSVSEIPIGELASYLKIMDRVANRQNLASYKIAENFKKVSEQFGVQLSDDFVNVPEYVQQTLDI